MGAKVRSCVCIQIFFACFIVYMLRVCLAVNILAMVRRDKLGASSCIDNTSVAVEPLPHFGPRYDWHRIDQGIVLGSYHIGCFLTYLPGDYLAERYGGMIMILISTVCAGTLTALIPLGATVHVWMVIVLRFLIGLASGVVYPAIQLLYRKWSAPDEVAIFGAALIGNTVGTVVTYPLAGVITEFIGWQWAFYIPAAISLVWCVLWFFTVSNSPSEHRCITDEEHTHISETLSSSTWRDKKYIPYKGIMASVAFWALTVAHFGSLWGLYLLLNNGPMYMNEVFGFNLYISGALAALPHLARVIFGVIFTSVADLIAQKRLMTNTVTRKVFTLFSHIIPGLLLISVMLAECSAIFAISVIVLALGINGAATVSNLQNFQDLSPVYAGTLFEITKSIDSITGFLTPCVTGFITLNKSDVQEWITIYIIAGGMYIVCGIVFILFGSGKRQRFDDFSPDWLR